MQAIETKYTGPTDSRGSRITARAQAGRISVPYDHALDFDENHDAAARALVVKLGWLGSWVGAQAPDGRFVYVDRSCTGFTVRRSRKVTP